MTRPRSPRLGHGPVDEVRTLVATTLAALDAGRRERTGPLPAGGPAAVHAAALAALTPGATGVAAHGGGTADLLAATGSGADAALTELTRMLSAGSADPADPRCAAHLHCPPLPVAVAADLAVSVLNPSLDSWDQAPAASTVETAVVAALARLVGYDPATATGTVTTGGTESNLLGLFLGRDCAGPAAPTVLCSAVAHHSVRRACGLLEGTTGPLVVVDVDREHRMDIAALRRALAAISGPAIVVATAGTTDTGAIDPLTLIADAVGAPASPAGPGAGVGAHRSGRRWLHVDAAYGGGALFSERLAGRLRGLDRADSVALDLHKLGWQPAPAGVFLTRRADVWRPLETEVAYLNPADEEEVGFTSLLGRSLRTTRRPDSFKIAVTLRALGRSGLGALVDACHDLARHAAATIDADPRLELAAPVTLTTVLFRYRPAGGPTAGARFPGHLKIIDYVNAQIRQRLLRSGEAVVGRTAVGADHAVHLKLTLLNPAATPADVDALLGRVADTGDLLARHIGHAGDIGDGP